MSVSLVAPFPYLGGKRRVASEVWRRFGPADVYAEPFAGSLAMLLANPHPLPTREVVCDTDGLICNVWRALARAPDEVADHADYPSIHQDLFARHLWLRRWADENSRRLVEDPDYYDARAAGWWIWGKSQWIGRGWCVGKQYDMAPYYYSTGGGRGVQTQRTNTPARTREDRIGPWFRKLAERLAQVVVLNNSWERGVCDHALAVRHEGTAACVFMDPPYTIGNRVVKTALYAHEEDEAAIDDAAIAAYRWAAENGDRFRIAYCCHVGDFEVPAGWDSVARKFAGFGAISGKKTTEAKDLIMFSPACLDCGVQNDLFS